MQKSTIYYINIGERGNTKGNSEAGRDVLVPSTYNGGGHGYTHWSCWGSYSSSGGGATHIATRSGLISSLESYKGTLVSNQYYNSSTITIVAGGGGGGYYYRCSDYDKSYFTGGDGGGVNGGGTSGLSNYTIIQAGGGTQISGGNGGTGCYNWSGTGCKDVNNGSFGKGANNPGNGGYHGGGSGGGSGFYGGGGGNHMSGGGGSGYIASSNLISTSTITKHMTCYSCTTSSVAATRTNSNTNVSATATADYSKTGNGYAKITYLGPTV